MPRSINSLPSQERLRSVFDYDENTGNLTHRSRPAVGRANNTFNARFAGKVAGSTFAGAAYVLVRVDGKPWLAHRVIWKMHYGKEPTELIDHINGNGQDNRIVNLREATSRDNCLNSSYNKNTTSGLKGVHYHAASRKWMAKICLNGKQTYLGCFVNPEEAAIAYNNAAEVYHGVFAFHNRPD